MSTIERKPSGYDEWHKQRIANRRNRVKKKEAEIKEHNIGQTLLSKEYLCNKFNLLRLVVLIVTMLLLFTCILYGVGSILVLSLDDFWCDSYTWDEISNHNRLNGEATGVGGCYVSQANLPLNDAKLFATDVNENALVVKTNIYPWAVIKLLVFFLIACVLLFLFVKYCLRCLTDCKTTLKGDWCVLVAYFFVA